MAIKQERKQEKIKKGFEQRKNREKRMHMETIILRKGWIRAASKLNDKQFREFIMKVTEYGFSECQEDVYSRDDAVNVMLEVAKPTLEEYIYKYLRR